MTLKLSLTQCNLGSYKTAYFGDYKTLNILVLNCKIHLKVLIYVNLQFKSEFKENYLASTSLNIPLMLVNIGLAYLTHICLPRLYSTTDE